MKDKFVIYTSIGSGFSVGIFVSFLLVVLVNPDGFDKPLDVIWTGLLSVIGTIFGGLIGGGIAYFIALKQVEIQKKEQMDLFESSQKTIADQLLNELSKNKSTVDKLLQLLPSDRQTADDLAIEIISGDAPLLEGMSLLLDVIELEYIHVVRSSLQQTKYYGIHNAIQSLIKIQRLGNRLLEIKNKDYLRTCIIRIKRYCDEFIQHYETL